MAAVSKNSFSGPVSKNSFSGPYFTNFLFKVPPSWPRITPPLVFDNNNIPLKFGLRVVEGPRHVLVVTGVGDGVSRELVDCAVSCFETKDRNTYVEVIDREWKDAKFRNNTSGEKFTGVFLFNVPRDYWGGDTRVKIFDSDDIPLKFELRVVEAVGHVPVVTEKGEYYLQVVKSPRHVLIVTDVGAHIEDKWLGCSVIGFETGGTKTRITFMNWEDKRVDGSVAPLARENMYVDESVVPAPYVSPPQSPPTTPRRQSPPAKHHDQKLWRACRPNGGVAQCQDPGYDPCSRDDHYKMNGIATAQVTRKHGRSEKIPAPCPAYPAGERGLPAARAKKAKKEAAKLAAQAEEATVAGYVKVMMRSEQFQKDFKAPNRTNIREELLQLHPDIKLSENRMKRAIQSVTEYAGYQSYRLKNEG